jgi:hypothetical protein
MILGHGTHSHDESFFAKIQSVALHIIVVHVPQWTINTLPIVSVFIGFVVDRGASDNVFFKTGKLILDSKCVSGVA